MNSEHYEWMNCIEINYQYLKGKIKTNKREKWE